MRIRPAHSSDASAVAELLSSVHRADSTAGRVDSRLFVALVADQSSETARGRDQVVGLLRLATEPPTNAALSNLLDSSSEVLSGISREVLGLAVSPQPASRQTEQALLSFATTTASSQGLRAVLVAADGAGDLAALCRGEGWTEVGTMPDGSGAVFAAPQQIGRTTELVHSGVRPGPERAVATGISVSTTFSMERVGEYGEFDYARSQNPTRKALEEALAAAEGARYAMAFSSGLAAIDSLCRLLVPGQAVLIGADAYGGTWRLLSQVWGAYGIQAVVGDTTDLKQLGSHWDPCIALALVETPSNPTLAITDIAGVAALAHEHGALLAVDSTFATPWVTQPLLHGADVVVHSTTKYIGGHSDVVGGCLVTDSPLLAERFSFCQKAVGAVPGPFDSFLTLRGLRTLGLRVERQSATAQVIAEMLASHPDVEAVFYPGLPSHPGYEVGRSQMRSGGGMISFIPLGGRARAVSLCESTRLFTLAESLGAVESLIEHPSTMTHAGSNGTQLEVPEGLVRLSVGIEDPDDLLADLQRALAISSPVAR